MKSGQLLIGHLPRKHLNNEQNPGCLGHIGDEILPSYVGITINHCKDPY